MNPYGYDGPEQFRPLSPWEYFGYTLLFSIPLIGFVGLIIFSFRNNNINLRNFARSYFCMMLVAWVIAALFMLLNLSSMQTIQNLNV